MIFARGSLYDMDSYYFAGISCGTIDFRPETDSFFTGLFFPLLPCDLLAFKAVLLGLFTLCVFIVERIGRLVSQRYAHWLFFIMGGSLSFYTYFSRFEDDTLGMPFVFGSLYFLTRFALKKDYRDFLMALGICGVGFLFWKGIAIWGLVVLSAGLFGWLASAAILYFFSEMLIPRFFPLVSEELPLAGVLSSGLILVGALAVPSYLIPSVSLSFMLALIKLKYSLFLGLLCGLGLYIWLCKKSFFEGESKTVLGLKKPTTLLLLMLVVNAAGILGILQGPPSVDIQNLAQTFTERVHSEGLSSAFNDWELGHLIRYHGIQPSNEYGPPSPSFDGINGFVLTRQGLDCPVFASVEEIYAYDCR